MSETTNQYRKKSVVVEAEQFWPDAKPLPFADRAACNLDSRGWYVITAHLQRTSIVAGDWIIAEPDGEHFYPCKPDIFEATYEAATPPASEPSEEVVVNVSELRDGEENDGTLRSMDLQLNGRGIDVLVNTPVGNRMTYAVMVDGKMQSSGTVAPEQPVADAEAILSDELYEASHGLPHDLRLIIDNAHPQIKVAALKAMQSYARRASARAVEAERQRLARFLVDEHRAIDELLKSTVLSKSELDCVPTKRAALQKFKSWLAGEGEKS